MKIKLHRYYSPLVFLFLLSLGIVLFSNAQTGPFIMDDITKIVNNTDIKKIENLPSSLFYGYSKSDSTSPTRFRNDPSRPLVYLAYTLLYHFYELNTWPYHLLSIYLHIFVSFLVFLIVRSIILNTTHRNVFMGPFLCALVFFVWPINAGTVMYTFGLSDILSTFFILLSCYVYFKSNKPYVTAKSHALSCLFLILALGSKQIAVVIPLLFFVYDFVLRFQGSLKKAIWHFKNWLPSTSLVLIYLVARYIHLGGIGDLEALEKIDATDYFSVQGISIIKYITLALVPSGLTIDHSMTVDTYDILVQALAWLVVAAVLTSCFLLSYRKNTLAKLFAFGMFFYLICLLPVSSVFPAIDVFVERRAYLPNVMLAFIFALDFERFGGFNLMKPFRYGATGLFFIYCLIMAGVTYQRNETFQNKKSVWFESLEVYPKNFRALNNLGIEFFSEKNYERAKNIFEYLDANTPPNAYTAVNLANVYIAADNKDFNPEKALSYLIKAYTASPNDWTITYNMASTYKHLKKIDLAEKFYLRTLELYPNSDLSYYELGMIYLDKGQKQKAKGSFEAALSKNPNLVLAQDQLNKL